MKPHKKLFLKTKAPQKLSLHFSGVQLYTRIYTVTKSDVCKNLGELQYMTWKI